MLKLVVKQAERVVQIVHGFLHVSHAYTYIDNCIRICHNDFNFLCTTVTLNLTRMILNELMHWNK